MLRKVAAVSGGSRSTASKVLLSLNVSMVGRTSKFIIIVNRPDQRLADVTGTGMSRAPYPGLPYGWFTDEEKLFATWTELFHLSHSSTLSPSLRPDPSRGFLHRRL